MQLDPKKPAIEGFRLVLADLAATIDGNWQGTVDQIDPTCLHEFRIATRRTRTVLGAAKRVLPAHVLDHASQEFRWLAGLTGTPRDLDVYLIEWAQYTEPLGVELVQHLEPVRALLLQRRADARIDLADALRSDGAVATMHDWSGWLAEALDDDDLPKRADRPLGRVVAKRIRSAHERLVERGRLIGPDTPAAQVHDLRKDAKKLRYLLESFGDLFAQKAVRKYVKRLKALQDNLGEHQDAAVHVELLADVVAELQATGYSPETMFAIGELTERLSQQRAAARAEFARRFAGYDTRSTERALAAVLDGKKR